MPFGIAHNHVALVRPKRVADEPGGHRIPCILHRQVEFARDQVGQLVLITLFPVV